ncbi:DUF4377 domain-containing protein [Christiangramia sp. SM2212]|uniref:DUF4377 domain-containing protein n=1 Tax=Christiangramia sediminicola TaxID=3073267 RepID=A0ABU1ENR5_9FLAO|nr:DUF4377 domain-containing protein [Christiangramia sp. SM2212]MDR5590035.1 DUF4377 domain-containing protein [Christiangramia sp. SM2212]
MRCLPEFIAGVIIILFSCSTSFAPKKDIDVRLDHYKTTAVGLELQLVFRIQEWDKVGTEEWSQSFEGVRELDYESGFIYDLKIKVIEVSNPLEDSCLKGLKLVEVISIKKASESAIISIPIIWYKHNVFLTGNESLGFGL